MNRPKVPNFLIFELEKLEIVVKIHFTAISQFHQPLNGENKIFIFVIYVKNTTLHIFKTISNIWSFKIRLEK